MHLLDLGLPLVPSGQSTKPTLTFQELHSSIRWPVGAHELPGKVSGVCHLGSHGTLFLKERGIVIQRENYILNDHLLLN